MKKLLVLLLFGLSACQFSTNTRVFQNDAIVLTLTDKVCTDTAILGKFDAVQLDPKYKPVHKGHGQSKMTGDERDFCYAEDVPSNQILVIDTDLDGGAINLNDMDGAKK